MRADAGGREVFLLQRLFQFLFSAARALAGVAVVVPGYRGTPGCGDLLLRAPETRHRRFMTRSMAHRDVRVVHVGKFYPPHRGGMESHLAALCGALRERVEVEVLVASDSRHSSR